MEDLNKERIDELSVNAIRILSADAIQKAKSGHPGLPLGCAPVGYEVWANHLKHNPGVPDWCDRDRFVLSGGHGSMLLYSLLHLFGYEKMDLDAIKNFRQLGSATLHREWMHQPVLWDRVCPWRWVWLWQRRILRLFLTSLIIR